MICSPVTFSRFSREVKARFERLGRAVMVSFGRADPKPMVSFGRADPKPMVSFGRMDRPSRVNFGVICTIEKAEPYLRVEPETVWLMKDNDFEGEAIVWSNVQWTIE